MGDYGYWQGAERATGRALGIGMNLMELQAQQQNRQQALAMEQEKLGIMKSEHNLKMDQEQKKIAAGQRPMNMRLHPYYLGLSDESKKVVDDYFVSNGLTDKNGVGTTENILYGTDMIEKSSKLFKIALEPTVIAKENAVIEAWGVLQDANVKGDEKKIKEAQANFNKIYMEAGQVRGDFDTHYNTLLKKEENEENRKSREDIAAAQRDLQRTLAGNKNVGPGKPPTGYRYTPDGELEPIPGGPADTKFQNTYAKDLGRVESLSDSSDKLAADARALANHPGIGRITGTMGYIPNVRGSEASNAQAKLDSLKAQSAFTTLQNMREMSKSGGALGQVSDMENKMLQAALDSLDTAQSEKQMKDALENIAKIAEKASKRIKTQFERQYTKSREGGVSNQRAPSVRKSLSDY